MKILICTDGSEQSKKALRRGAEIARGCSADEIAIIYVYDNKLTFPFWGEDYRVTKKDLERFEDLVKRDREKQKTILVEAGEMLQEMGFRVRTFFKEGHPVETIAKVTAEEGFDMVIVGSRGLGGLKKLFLGSVSNAVVQQVKASILVVK